LRNQQVPDYFSGDAHLGWQPIHALELGIYGRNLFDARHPEFGVPAVRKEIPRSFFGKATWQF